MLTIIAFLVVLGVLIFIHELGHFLVAKWSGVGVEAFSLGFGPRVFGIKRGETDYKISLIPFGGYVKMTGEAIDSEETYEDLKHLTEYERLRRDEDFIEKSFQRKPLFKRVAIVAAGPAMNLVLAAILFPVIYMIGVSVPAFLYETPKVGYVPSAGPAYEAGVMQGDIIDSIDGVGVSTWEGAIELIALNPGREVELKVKRGEVLLTKKIVPVAVENKSFGVDVGVSGFYPPMPAVVGAIKEGYPAEKAGLEAGDLIKSIGGKAITHWSELNDELSSLGARQVVFERAGVLNEVTITPVYDEESDRYFIGVIKQDDMTVKSYGPVEAVKRGYNRAVELTTLLFTVLKGLVFGDYSMDSLGGPIMIAKVAGQAASSGLVPILFLVAFLSLQLGIINLFPIPVLDGGHLFFFGFEWIIGKPLNEEIMIIAQNIGMVLLLGLMIFVTWNDIARMFL
ncbi:MAG: RIP metalloprotease RseP [Deltaproteobacteria bacterium]|nr:RIP metalloprotease RseP [Deltaproteobacteria bacterium]